MCKWHGRQQNSCIFPLDCLISGVLKQKRQTSIGETILTIRERSIIVQVYVLGFLSHGQLGRMSVNQLQTECQTNKNRF